MRSRLSRAVSSIPRLLSVLLTIRVGGLLLAALALWIFYEIAEDVLKTETQAFDTAILLALRRMHTPLLDRIMTAITFWGEPEVLLILAVSLGIWLLLKRRAPEATTLGVGVVGAGGLNYWLKELFHRERPALWERTVDVRYYSFPSGHAMVSMVMYGLIGYLLATRFRRVKRVWIYSLSILLILAIGFSRLYLGVHWPSDVGAGYAAGLVWLMACILELEIWRKHRSAHSRSK